MTILAVWMLLSPVLSNAQESPRDWTPEDTVILANRVDVRFARDFSTLLKYLRLECVILEHAAVPDAVKDKDLILIGRLEATHTGEILGQLMTTEEVKAVRAGTGEPVILEKDSPWTAGRRVILCVGADLLAARDAAEQAISTIAEYAASFGLDSE